jgi:cob(I)alamin adenosyltransferase
MARIYTKHGDQGQSSLVGGERVNKNHPRLNAYGTVDELCSHLGFIASLLKDKNKDFSSLIKSIFKIQNELFQIGSLLACAKPEIKKQLPNLTETHVLFVEHEIDSMEKELPKLKNFIIPGGLTASCSAHIARTVCRRAEREIFTLIEEGQEKDSIIILKYINRLSDFLFVSARWINHKEGIEDQIWSSESK